MSQFHFPRLHFSGQLKINVGTGNNDDYSPDLRVVDSANVKLVSYPKGVTNDKEFVDWATSIQPYTDSDGDIQHDIPFEWNYYGDMGLYFQNLSVQGVEYEINKLITTGDLVNSTVNIGPASICDINPEDVPASQIFADNFSLEVEGSTILSGKPTKGVTRWINFQKNLNLSASEGASGVFYSVISKEEATYDENNEFIQKALTMEGFKGWKIRYVIYCNVTEQEDIKEMEARYKKILNNEGGFASPSHYMEWMNLKDCIVLGTLSPWLEGELASITLSRQLNGTFTFANPGSYGNGPVFKLAPCLLDIDDDKGIAQIDAICTFPEYAGDDVTKNGRETENLPNNLHKYDIGNLSLMVKIDNGTADSEVYKLGDIVGYNDYQNYVKNGGLLTINYRPEMLKDGLDKCTFFITADKVPSGSKDVMSEAPYMIGSDQDFGYFQQNHLTPVSNGTPNEQILLTTAVKGVIGVEMDFQVAYYEAIPVFSADNSKYMGLQEITISKDTPFSPQNEDTKNTGVNMYMFIPKGVDPANGFAKFSFKTDPYLVYRILPEDNFSDAPVPLTWEYIYEKVLRYYDLIYPAMGAHLPFIPEVWSDAAAVKIFERMQPEMFSTVSYMPRTRDMSDTRRKLVEAWLNQYMVPLQHENQEA